MGYLLSDDEKETVFLTRNEIKEFNDLKLKLENSISPGEAEYYLRVMDNILYGRLNSNLRKNR